MSDPKTGPTFIGIGAQRAGSTWLANALSRHPDIFVTPKKELHYFDASPEYPTPSMCAAKSRIGRLWGRNEANRNWRFWLRHAQQRGERVLTDPWWRRFFWSQYDDEWYQSLFQRPANIHHTGEITPGYCLLQPSHIQWVRRVAPEAKILLVLRNPVDRDWSQYRFAKAWSQQTRERGAEAVSIDFLQSAEVRRRGDYARIIADWRRVWGKALGVFCFEDLVKEPMPFLHQVLEFLNVEDRRPDTIRQMIPPHIPNRQSDDAIPPEIIAQLHRSYHIMYDALRDEFGEWVEQWQTSNLSRMNTLQPGTTTIQ